MQQFTGWEYLLLDAANQFGHDKRLFEDRLRWVLENLDRLEQLIPQADEKTRNRYIKATMAIRKAQHRQPTGHLVGFDACCSGLQIMSALTGCVVGATATGLVDPHRRADAYSELTLLMQRILGTSVNIHRADAKQALMTVLYGSTRTPKVIYGEDTAELRAFYEAVQQLAPGAWELLQVLLNSWQPYALLHQWQLPDGFDVRIKVMETKETRIEVDELDHATFTYQYRVNEGQEKGISLPANVIHSVDAYVLRCLVRRCSYNAPLVKHIHHLIEITLLERLAGGAQNSDVDPALAYYQDLYQRFGMADLACLQVLTDYNIGQLSTRHLQDLKRILNSMLQHVPFDVVSVHDEFLCHANHMNHLRKHYREIFAQLADSTLLDAVLSQIHGVQDVYQKHSPDLSRLILQSNYALS